MSNDVSPTDSPSSLDPKPSTQRAQEAVESLSQILGPLPDSITLSDNPPLSLLNNHHITSQITHRLRSPTSGAGDDPLCRWLYDTFQSTNPDLQLIVLSFLPTIAGVYLSRAISRQPLAGFEAVLLALYAHETTSRAGEPVTITLPNLTNPSVYHEAKPPAKNRPTEEPDVAVLSPALEPHGTVRSTKRARIVGVALELYFNKISLMPLSSKMEFCRFCMAWSGYQDILDESKEKKQQEEKKEEEEEEEEEKGRRIPLPWELLQPMLRVLGHCLMGPQSSEEMKAMANDAARCLHERALHDMNPQAILASGSLLSLGKMKFESVWESDCVPSCCCSNEAADQQVEEKEQPVNQD
ncbi:hypothetical protein J5N97_014587 [Dioscorea zingiberensis]|uniref:Hyccin n=1 Tax=Dioscorea zingiberensis TaxID=325984 RepID=A0A9D5HJX2_9LILI|nr:hypothetical protein J5N97_014587 [Dioscorea zingiberensis]